VATLRGLLGELNHEWQLVRLNLYRGDWAEKLLPSDAVTGHLRDTLNTSPVSTSVTDPQTRDRNHETAIDSIYGISDDNLAAFLPYFSAKSTKSCQFCQDRYPLLFALCTY